MAELTQSGSPESPESLAPKPRSSMPWAPLSLGMGLLALGGWGTFAYSTLSSATAEQQFHQDVSELKASQGQLITERNELRARLAELKARRDQLTTERDELKGELFS